MFLEVSLAIPDVAGFPSCEYWIARSSKTGLIVRHGGQLSFVNMITKHSFDANNESKDA